MSTDSPQSAASADLSRTQAGLSQQLSNVAYPELKNIIDLLGREIGPGGEPASIRSAYGAARSQLNQGYADASQDTLGLLQQQAKQSGERFLPGQVNAAYGTYARGLEEDRSQAMRRLDFGEQQASLTQYTQLLQMLGQGSGAALNLGRGYSGNQAAAIGGLSGSSQFGSALGGAASGAAIGAQTGNPWAIAGGAVVGGLGGYFSAG